MTRHVLGVFSEINFAFGRTRLPCQCRVRPSEMKHILCMIACLVLNVDVGYSLGSINLAYNFLRIVYSSKEVKQVYWWSLRRDRFPWGFAIGSRGAHYSRFGSSDFLRANQHAFVALKINRHVNCFYLFSNIISFSYIALRISFKAPKKWWEEVSRNDRYNRPLEFMKTAPGGYKLAKQQGNAKIISRFYSLAVETGNASRVPGWSLASHSWR